MVRVRVGVGAVIVLVSRVMLRQMVVGEGVLPEMLARLAKVAPERKSLSHCGRGSDEIYIPH